MALHTDLPIYKHAYGLLRLSLVGSRHMPRDFKNSLGSRIHDECIEVLSLIADANQLPDTQRPPVIQAMLRRVGKIEFLLRVCNDEHLISPRIWAEAIVLLQALGSQGGGWLRYLNPRKTVLQPVARGIDFVGHVIKPWSRTTRRKTVRVALHRLETLPAADVYAAGNSYLGLVRQATNSHTDQARFARALLKRGHAVDGDLTRIFRRNA